MITMPAFTWKLFWKVIPYVIAVALVFYLGSKLHDHVFAKGANSVQVEWDKEKAAYDLEMARLKQDYNDREEDHREENRRITNALSEAKLNHTIALADARRIYDQRLRDSEARSALYQRQAQGGTTERGSLADHAGRLDATLEEGRHLVRELRETLGLRDQQLRTLSDQIKNDRALIEGDTQ